MSLSKAAIPLCLKDEQFHPSHCIICYSKTKTKGLSGGAAGRKRVREVAEKEQTAENYAKRMGIQVPQYLCLLQRLWG